MKRSPRWSFLITAAGNGTRLGGTPKQFRLLAGIPVWKWSCRLAESLREKGLISEIVMTVPQDCREKLCDEKNIILTEGGATRSESVLNGLKCCSGSHVLVHDGARPFISEALCLRLMEAAELHGAAMPLLPSQDSLKKLTKDKISCADRSLYYRTQTPQAFEKQQLVELLEGSPLSASDEAGLLLDNGISVAVVEGEERNFKITTQYDWDIAVALTEKGLEKRTGHGYDIHQLVDGRPLIIGGLRIEEADFGLYGHSDADLLAHTVMDAMLGAAGEPDIGTLFPASDEKWRGADSMQLLAAVLAKLKAKGWRPDWIDATLIAQRPRLGALVPKIIENMNRALGGRAEEKLFNMKVKSAEHCGSAGRGECMICHAVATLSRFNYEWSCR